MDARELRAGPVSTRAERGPLSVPCVAFLALLCSLTVSRQADAQTLRGRILASEDGSPVSAAFVSLEAAARGRVDADLTSAGGFFQLEASAPGTYRVRVERIGFEEWVSEPLELAPGEARSARYRVRVRPVRLADLRVRVRSNRGECVARPGEAAGVMEVWNEARKALQQTRWAQEQRLYRFSVSEWEKELGRRARRVKDVSSRSRDWLAATPYRSLPVDELARDGFVREEADRSFSYYAPDATTLLSYEFVESHCFGLRWRNEGDRRFVGLAFEPMRSRRRVPEVRGVLWIDEETAELDHVDFQYVNLPFRRAADEAGGRVELQRLPDGGFIVRRWWIRMPRVQEEYLLIRGAAARGERVRHRIVGYEEEGAEVTTVHTSSGERLRLEEGAAVTGTVRYASTLEAVKGVVVELIGPSDSLYSVTDSAGSFRFEGLEAGEHRVVARDPRREVLGLAPEGRGLSADLQLDERGEEQVGLFVPSEATLFRRACPALDLRRNVGVVAGKVRSREMRGPVEGARVVITWSEEASPGEVEPEGGEEPGGALSATTDERGGYRICGVPGGLEVSLKASAPGFTSASLSFDQSARIVRRHIFLEARTAP